LEGNSTTDGGRRKFARGRAVLIGQEVLAAPMRSSDSVTTLTATSARYLASSRSRSLDSRFNA
jgi:hypothetical protein